MLVIDFLPALRKVVAWYGKKMDVTPYFVGFFDSMHAQFSELPWAQQSRALRN